MPTRRAAVGVAYSREFLERLARILVHSGHSPRALSREFADICRKLEEPTRPFNPARLNYISDLPHVIAHWHADPRYLDSRGAPVALPLKARGASVRELISRVLPEADGVAVFKSLVKLGALRRRGTRYLPKDRYLAFNPQRLSAMAHGLTTLLGLLRTVEHNLASGARHRLVERAAINPAFPLVALPAFHQRLKPLASEFLWQIDGDMRRREVPGGGKPATRLGVAVFAFENPLASEPVRASRPGKLRPARAHARRKRARS
ncbi:MAG: DUF6502 family protein [Gammaproteobacteria bacterium]